MKTQSCQKFAEWTCGPTWPVRVVAERHQAAGVGLVHGARAAPDSHPARSRTAGLQPDSRVSQLGNTFSNRVGTPVRPGVARARDPVPAQLRFAVLLRDGFRRRYCGH
jgi:hypothetical protein